MYTVNYSILIFIVQYVQHIYVDFPFSFFSFFSFFVFPKLRSKKSISRKSKMSSFSSQIESSWKSTESNIHLSSPFLTTFSLFLKENRRIIIYESWSEGCQERNIFLCSLEMLRAFTKMWLNLVFLRLLFFAIRKEKKSFLINYFLPWLSRRKFFSCSGEKEEEKSPEKKA